MPITGAADVGKHVVLQTGDDLVRIVLSPAPTPHLEPLAHHFFKRVDGWQALLLPFLGLDGLWSAGQAVPCAPVSGPVRQPPFHALHRPSPSVSRLRGSPLRTGLDGGARGNEVAGHCSNFLARNINKAGYCRSYCERGKNSRDSVKPHGAIKKPLSIDSQGLFRFFGTSWDASK